MAVITEFKIKYIKEVIINDLFHDDLENFLYVCRINGTSSAIWVEGIIILLVTAPFTDTYAKQFLEGIRIYEQVVFVKYPKYTKSVKWNGGNYELPLKNYNNFQRFKDLAKWIKLQSSWKTIPEVIS